MARGSVNLIEKHLEKGVLGLTVLFLLAMVSLYLIRSPNQIDYGGQKVGPDELAAAIQRDADSLQTAIDRVEPPDTQVEDSSGALRQRHAAGILAPTEDTVRPLPSTLRLAADFGRPLPDLSEDEEASGDIVLVTPLAPAVPLTRTGRNLVIRQRPELAAELSEGRGPQPDSDEPPQPVEIPWVTIASYFDFNAQQTAMTKAKYATYRSKVYIAGLDVQRQMLLPDGAFSDWQDVRDSLAIPRLEFPTPEFDELTGNMVNKDEVDRVYSLVKVHQLLLMQPPFYQTLAGEPWKMPPLEGYADQEELAVAGVQPPEEEQDKPGGRPRGATHTTGRRLRGGGAISVGGGAVSVGGGSPSQATGRRSSAAQELREGRAKAQDDLRAAEDAYRNSQDDQAQRLAQQVLDNEYARAGDQKQAGKIINSIRALRQQEASQRGTTAAAATPGELTPTIAGAPTIAGRGRPAGATSPQQARTAAPGALVAHPDKPESLALWFHDDTVEAGKTYRYRMRVKLWNRYVGKMRALKDPEQAKQAVLVGDWSLPGESVTVTPSTYFFLSGATANKDAARVDVGKWYRGSWLKESFNVAVGDVIGRVESVGTGILDRQTLDEIREDIDFTTGAVVLDLRFDEPVVRRDSGGKGQFNLRPTDSLVMVYIDPADGSVKERVQIFDRNDPLLRRLKEDEL